jgi:hypothetical protein
MWCVLGKAGGVFLNFITFQAFVGKLILKFDSTWGFNLPLRMAEHFIV